MKAVNDDDELMFITQDGIMLRTDLAEVREIGRATQGVRLIKTNDDKACRGMRSSGEDGNETEVTLTSHPTRGLTPVMRKGLATRLRRDLAAFLGMSW
ncbi:MAG: DNA gyrase C-terminal beta-propeller domain-containing protein [Phycisphaerae bacterium]